MIRDEVSTYLIEEDVRKYKVPGDYSTSSKLIVSLALWLRNALKAIVSWLDKFDSPEKKVVEVNRVTLDTQKIEDAIYRHAHNAYTYGCRHPRYLIVGYNHLDMLKFQTADKPYLTNINLERIKPQFMGMQIVLVPWIDGVFVLPDLEEL